MLDSIIALSVDLLNKYSDDSNERCGFISNTLVIEVENISTTPDKGFDISTEDIIEYTDKSEVIATWHTHPGESSNLSGEDYSMFATWKNLYHVIIGKDGMKVYKWDSNKKAVMVVHG